MTLLDERLRHKVVVGASGRRLGCRVCRIGNTGLWGEANLKWAEPCNPTPEALDQFEQVARQRIADAESDLAYAAALRARTSTDSNTTGEDG